MRKKYLVTLTDSEREQLLATVRKGSLSARKLTRAHILLQADAGASDEAIATSLHVHRTTVERVRQRFVEGNLEEVLSERPRPGAKRVLCERRHPILAGAPTNVPWGLHLGASLV